MTTEQAAEHVRKNIVVLREDIARAKQFMLEKIPSPSELNPISLCSQWLTDQGITIPSSVAGDEEGIETSLTEFARGCGIQIAFCQALAELVSANELIASGNIAPLSTSLEWRTSHSRSGVPLKALAWYPTQVFRSSYQAAPSTDPDIFLRGEKLVSLDRGIREAINQALRCFRKGLNLPAIVMLAAATEATWMECGCAVAKKLGNAKLADAIEENGFGRIVADILATLRSGTAKAILGGAGVRSSNLMDAEVWTTTLREHRNTLHWGKARNFVAEHSDAACLLLAAPIHLATLEAIRNASA